LKEHATGEDIFNLTNKYLQENEINWSCCTGMFINGTKSMAVNLEMVEKSVFSLSGPFDSEQFYSPHVLWIRIIILIF
jgi:hypothetical protein